MTSTKRSKRTKRPGYTLVLLAMLLFGIFGLAALVIDVGFARLAQSEMQTAADTAALEGLRQQYSPAAASDPAGADDYRRQQASTIATQVFVDPSGTANYGAGPVLNFSGGVGDPSLAAAQTIEQPGNPPVYQPSLQLNSSNATHGDIVAGNYGFNAGYDASSPADEDANYNRRDFVPSSGTAAATATAFLVRTRRTNNTSGLDQDSGTSSAGPTLPFLFGRGSLMARSGASNDLSISSGMTVRATAIAGPQPAKTVGPAYSGSGTLTASPQLAPFALRRDVWARLAASGSAASMTVDPLVPDSGAVVLDGGFRLTLTAIGQPLVTSTDETALAAGPQTTAAYVPIYADYGSQSRTIVGFVYYTNWRFTGGTLSLNQASATVQVGSQNVSPTLALPLPGTLAPADAAAMFQAHATLFAQYTLYTPALVNRYLGPNRQ